VAPDAKGARKLRERALDRMFAKPWPSKQFKRYERELGWQIPVLWRACPQRSRTAGWLEHRQHLGGGSGAIVLCRSHPNACGCVATRKRPTPSLVVHKACVAGVVFRLSPWQCDPWSRPPLHQTVCLPPDLSFASRPRRDVHRAAGLGCDRGCSLPVLHLTVALHRCRALRLPCHHIPSRRWYVPNYSLSVSVPFSTRVFQLRK
jgi:hypothetical protein